MTNELPVGWTTCLLEDVLKYEQPTKYIVESTNYTETGTPVLTAGKSFLLGYTQEKNGVFDAKDLPVIIFDDFTTATKFVDFPFKVKSSAMKILHADRNVDILYFYYLMQTIQYRAETHKRYWISEYAKQEVALPPLAEQKRIVGKIEELFAEVDKGVDLLKQKQAELKKYRQSVLSAAFSGKLYKTTDWQEKSIKDVTLYIQRGKSPQYADLSNYPIINQKCIRWNTLETEHLKYLRQSFFSKITTERFVQPNDILWNSTGTGTIGRAYLYKGNEISSPVVVDSHVTIVRANTKEILPIFLYYFIMSPIVQFSIESMQNGSTNQVELAREKIRTTQLNLPSLPEQEQLVAEIEQRFEKADILEKSIEDALESAEKLKQSILKKAFEGKLVPQDPADEPAKVLLERIKSEQSPKKGKKKCSKQ